VAEKRTTSVKFSSQKKTAYLELLKQGQRRGAAAEAVGVHRDTVRNAMLADPEFASAVDAAEMDVNEVVENALLEQAKKGNTTAIQVWLYNRTPSRWKDQRNLGKGDALEGILESLPPEFARGVRAALAAAISGPVAPAGGAAAAAGGTGGRPLEAVPGAADGRPE
jgi:hypothetical protein